MSEEQIKKMMEEKRSRELSDRLAKGLTQAADGSHLFSSQVTIGGEAKIAMIPRQVNASINFSNILEDLIKNIDFVGNYSYDAMGRGVLLLLQHIPETDQDDQFKQDVANAKYIEKVPTGRYGGWGGNTFEIMDEYETYDFLAIYRAIFNLLRRRGVYETPKLWDTKRTGVLFQRRGENEPVERASEGQDKVVESEKP